MHEDILLGGPVWLFAQFLILGTVLLSAYILADSLRPARRAKVAGRLREPLWVYTGAMAVYIGLLVAVQVIPGLQLASAVVSIATPFALALGVAYLLRAVFPAPAVSHDSEQAVHDPGDSGR